MDYIAAGQRVFDLEIEALQTVREQIGDSFSRSVELLKKTLERRGKIVVVGVGKSGNIGHKLSATLNSTGSTSVVLHSQNALHGDLGMVCAGDAIIALSYSGETVELLDLLPFLRRLDVNIIAMVGKPFSSLEQLSDQSILCPVEREACPLNLAPTSSSTAMLVMGDALAMSLLEARGFTEKDFSQYHPGGSLGRALLTRVKDIMRTGKSLAKVKREAPITEVLGAMSKARSGVAIVVTPDGGLEGVFTHGDFARAFQKNPLIGGSCVGEQMTRSPIVLNDNDLAVEALNTIDKHSIDDIVVLDTHKKVVGLVDTQDFARLKLI